MQLFFRSIFIIFLIVQYSCLSAQSTKKADELMQDYKYSEAIVELKPLAEKGNIQAIRKIAECYRKTNDFVNAEKYYAIVVADKNSNKKNWLYYGQILMNNNKYLDADKWLQGYLDTKPNDSILVKTLLESCAKANQSLTPKRKIKFENLDWINSNASDFCAVDFGNQIIFTSSREGKTNAYDGMSYSKVYIAEKKTDSSWTIEPMKGIINSKNFNSGPASVHLASNKIYYTKNNVQYGDAIKNKKGDVTLKIFEAKLNNSETKDFKELSFNDVEYSCAYPSINHDGDKIFFTSDRAGGFGGKDIYYSMYANGVWSKPKNAGKNINTAGDERYPFIHNDGTLYFSSTGHQGFGGMDIFKSTLNRSGEYLEAENLGMPINSSADDFGFFLDSNYAKGYISSNRPEGKGADDIYIFNYDDLLIHYTIYDGNIALDSVRIKITNQQTNQEQIFYTNKKGIFETYLLPNQNYAIEVSKENYTSNTYSVKTSSVLIPIKKNINLEMIKKEN
jgi:hypothetical protein